MRNPHDPIVRADPSRFRHDAVPGTIPFQAQWRMPIAELLQWILRAILAAGFVFAGVTHFLPGPARTMAAMIPPALTRRMSATALVRITGVCEVAGGVGLLVPATRFAAGIALVLFLIAVFPANAVAAADPARFGAVAIPFWPRYAGQLVLIVLCTLAVV